MSAVIQYSKELNHFRTLRLFGRERTDVLDGATVTRYTTVEDRYRLLEGDEKSWRNYIIAYRLSMKTS
jgi:hypothetical protein